MTVSRYDRAGSRVRGAELVTRGSSAGRGTKESPLAGSGTPGKPDPGESAARSPLANHPPFTATINSDIVIATLAAT